MGKSIWPVIAEFSYDDARIKFKCPIVAKLFYIEDKVCPVHGPVWKRDSEYSDTVCGKCNNKYNIDKKPMICLSVSRADQFINIPALLQSFSLVKWRVQGLRWGLSVRSYFQTLDGAIRCLNSPVNDPDFQPKKGVTVSMKMNHITDEMLGDAYKKYMKNKMIRNI